MIIISGTITVDPADHDKALDLFAPCTEATRAEDGNLSYGFYVDPAEPGAFRIYEEWADGDALDAHMVTPHMAELLGGFATVKVTGTELHRHDVASSERFM